MAAQSVMPVSGGGASEMDIRRRMIPRSRTSAGRSDFGQAPHSRRFLIISASTKRTASSRSGSVAPARYSILWSSLRRNWFHPALKKAELPMIRFHDLRHTAATLLLSQNLNPKIVQERLGHTQIATTIDIYGHVIPSMQKEASDRLDHLFTGEKTGHWLQNGYSKRGKPAPPEGAGPVSRRNHGGGFGRAGGTRTLDLLLPKQARYQLRYSPEKPSKNSTLEVLQGSSARQAAPLRRRIVDE